MIVLEEDYVRDALEESGPIGIASDEIDLQTAQIQRIIVTAYTSQHARHFVLTIDDAVEARHWLAQLAEHVALAVERDPQNAHNDTIGAGDTVGVNLGLTYRGLQILELDWAYLSVLREKAPAFADSAPVRAASRLGDTGDSDADWWEAPFKVDSAHVLLLLHSDAKPALDAKVAQLRDFAGAAALAGWDVPFEAEHITHTPGERRVHFGMRDGLTTAHIKGIHNPSSPSLHNAGEFLLGYQNDSEFNPWLLGDRPDHVAEFFKHGSFGVFRKLEQDEAMFREFVGLSAASLGEPRAYIIAKLVGRWADGQVVDEQSSTQAPPSLPLEQQPDNSFDFSKDLRGIGCPFGAHIRRMNPRKDPVIPFRRRPLIRRGMPYGKAFDQDHHDKRGLMGLFLCASIEDQFEHLIGEWADKNPIGVPNPGDARDPLAGNHGSAPSVFNLPMDSHPGRKVTGFRPFVTTRGTLYAFFPTKPALRRIADGSTHARS